jgi:hypothetical protein
LEQLAANRRRHQIERAVFKAASGTKQFERHRDGDLGALRHEELDR